MGSIPNVKLKFVYATRPKEKVGVNTNANVSNKGRQRAVACVQRKNIRQVQTLKTVLRKISLAWIEMSHSCVFCCCWKKVLHSQIKKKSTKIGRDLAIFTDNLTICVEFQLVKNSKVFELTMVSFEINENTNLCKLLT